MPLTDTRIRTAQPKDRPYKLVDGNGLVLMIQPNGSKLWRRRLRVSGRETMFAIGRYPEIGLSEARERAREAFRCAKKGLNPAQQRKLDRAKTVREGEATFRVLAEEWLSKKATEWEPATVRQRRRLLERYVFPDIGDLPVGQIDSAVVYPVLERVHAAAPSQTTFSRQSISGVFQLAIIKKLAKTDPVYVLRTEHRAPPTKHHRPLSRAELKRFLDALDTVNMQDQTRLAIRLALWTLCRSKEVIGARWEEFDLNAGVWTVPATRMKKREDHVVPLPSQAVAALRNLHAMTPNREVLFPNAHDPRRHASHTYLNKAVTRIGIEGFTAHGIRSTGSTTLHNMKFRSEVIERQLDHRERNKTKRSYNRAEYLEERLVMMQQWANYLDSIEINGNVETLRVG